LTEKPIIISREHYERLKKEQVILFGENNGEWTNEELENNAVSAAIEAAGKYIEEVKLMGTPVTQFTQVQLLALIQGAAWAYKKEWAEYVPF